MNLTAIVLTYNEEPNISRTLANLKGLPQVYVIDSFSIDKTVEIAKEFPNVTVFQRKFDEHTKQWEYARSLIKTEWVLALDADYQFSAEVLEEIRLILELNPQENGFFADFEYSIDGKIIKSGIYPSVCVLYRKSESVYLKDGHTQRLSTSGKTGKLQNKLIHDDRKSFSHWIQSQLKYAHLEAEKLSLSTKNELSKNDKIRLKSKITPIFVFFYCIFAKGGWKEGAAGWKYAYQRMLAEIILQYYLLDLKK
jgi:glycosyltransferase involved in cell wall biosynthesis